MPGTGASASWVETAGTFDADAELTIFVSGGAPPIHKEFGKKSDIVDIQAVLAPDVLGSFARGDERRALHRKAAVRCRDFLRGEERWSFTPEAPLSPRPPCVNLPTPRAARTRRSARCRRRRLRPPQAYAVATAATCDPRTRREPTPTAARGTGSRLARRHAPGTRWPRALPTGREGCSLS